MPKRKPKKQRKTRPQRLPRRPAVDPEQALEQGQRLIDGGRAAEAIELLAPLVEANPRLPEPLYMLGYARFQTGDLWDGLDQCERAQQLSRTPNYWYLLVFLYVEAQQALSPAFVTEAQFYLAVAEANTGRREARRRL